jgi:hypothetical protein
MVGSVGKRSAGPFSFSASPHLPHDSFAWGAFFMRNGLPHSGCGSPFVSYDIKDCRTNHIVRQVSYFSFAFGKLSGSNLVIKKSAVDLAKLHTCAVLHKGQIKAHRQSH